MPSVGVRGVLAITAFRRLFYTMTASSIGDWLGLLATASLAASLPGLSSTQQRFALSGVLVLRMLPALILGPLAGAFADRWDRRKVMVVTDVGRFAFFTSIPLALLFGSRGFAVTWLFLATFVVESITVFWIPAKEASVPNLVPREGIESANQLNLLTAYGTAPVAVVVFLVLGAVSSLLQHMGVRHVSQVDLALYVNGVSFLVSALVVYTLREISDVTARARRRGVATDAVSGVTGAVAADLNGEPVLTAPPVPIETERPSSVFADIKEGWSYARHSTLIRGLVMGMLGAFAAGGLVAGLATVFVKLLGGGNNAFGVLFAFVFLGLAAGMYLGPRLLRDLSRRRLFGLSIVGAGISLSVVGLLPNIVLVDLMTLLLGSFAGMAWVTGYTLIGSEVADDIRGRTWALIQSLVRIDLVLSLALGPLIAAAIGDREWRIGFILITGIPVVLVVAGIATAAVGVLAYRAMDDHPQVSLLADVIRLLRAWTLRDETGHPHQGVLIAFEGGEGSGKSTQTGRLGEWLRRQGLEVVTTREPGATQLGLQLRRILLDPDTGAIASRAETLLYAADRAQHVDETIRPALERGGWVVTDRYVDSTVAYQGAGRGLPDAELRELSRIAIGGVRPDLTIVLDIDPTIGLARAGASPDRMESEPLDFHERVRRSFTDQAARQPAHYLVVDASATPTEVARQVRERVADLLEEWREKTRHDTRARTRAEAGRAVAGAGHAAENAPEEVDA
ncbi:MAG: dTMP kinase [Frankiaceae bacterium]|jgi:dTMP kinase|nr:dTMP kinase [Frankiaceae bacterium]